MYHRDDGRYEYKRRDYHPYEQQDDKDKSKSSRRNRWDEKSCESNNSSNWSNDAKREGSIESSHWKSRKEDHDHERRSLISSTYSRARDRKSRSRSRSPFRRNFRDGVNPTKDEYNEHYNHSLKQVRQADIQPSSSRKNTSWSDSSDDDNESGNSKSNTSQHMEYRSSNEGKKEITPVASHHSKPSTGETETGNSSSAGISLKLGGPAKRMPLPKVISVPIPVKSTKVAAIFNTDDDESEEEMPPECKMRMKNVGRETKTSEGPNSFGKTKIGFCNMSHLAEKQLGEKTATTKKP